MDSEFFTKVPMPVSIHALINDHFLNYTQIRDKLSVTTWSVQPFWSLIKPAVLTPVKPHLLYDQPRDDTDATIVDGFYLAFERYAVYFNMLITSIFLKRYGNSFDVKKLTYFCIYFIVQISNLAYYLYK